MQSNPLAEPYDPYPVLLAAHSANLLIFFMPPALTDQPARAALLALANALQAQLTGLVRVLRIEEDNHSDVVRSFAVTRTPAFVLVRRGVELWRQVGLLEAAPLVELIKEKLR